MSYKQIPWECKHYRSKLLRGNYGAVCSKPYNYGCLLECTSFDHCPDFTPKTPQPCAHYGADGGCHKHSQKRGNIHVSIRCKAESGEPCEDYTTKTDKQ